MSTIGIVILAAGGSARLGTPKQLLPYQGVSLLRRAADTALASSCAPVVVVLGASFERCLLELQDLPLLTVENRSWKDGMGSSLRLGMERLIGAAPDALDAVILMLCDQPHLPVAVIEALVAEYRATGCQIAASEYGSTLGVPALFDRALFPELQTLRGAQGAKQILQRYPDRIHKLAFAGGEIDIDTAADYADLNRT